MGDSVSSTNYICIVRRYPKSSGRSLGMKRCNIGYTIFSVFWPLDFRLQTSGNPDFWPSGFLDFRLLDFWHQTFGLRTSGLLNLQTSDHQDFWILAFWTLDVWPLDFWPSDFWTSDFWPLDFWSLDFCPSDFWTSDFWPSDWDILDLPFRLHQFQIPNVLPESPWLSLFLARPLCEITCKNASHAF